MSNGLTPEAYSDVFERLEREGVRYVVVGGVAVVMRGHVRPIPDLDMVVNSEPGEMNRAVGVLCGLGFVPSIPLPPSLLTVLRMFDPSQREVNIIFRPHVPFAELWEDCEPMPLGRGVVRVASLEHLLRAKRIHGRPHDLSDIEALLRPGAGG